MKSVLDSLQITTEEQANARLSELALEIASKLQEAEELAKKFSLSFTISTKDLPAPIQYDGWRNYYDAAGWQSSSYDC
jgi:hypothetical protein